MLGVFQKLIANKAHDHEGFNILSTLIESLDYNTVMAQVGSHSASSAAWAQERGLGGGCSGVTGPYCPASTHQYTHFQLTSTCCVLAPLAFLLQYMPTVWGLLFSRLQQSRTHKFARALLMFLALFVCKQGAAAVAGSIEGVQPGLTLMVLQTVGVVVWWGPAQWWFLAFARSPSAINRPRALYPQAPIPRSSDTVSCCRLCPSCPCVQVWLPTMPSISGGHEEKLLVVATARMLSDCMQLAAPEAAELAGRLLAALVASLEGSGGASGSEEQGEEGPGEEEVAGYSAAYARLHNAYK